MRTSQTYGKLQWPTNKLTSLIEMDVQLKNMILSIIVTSINHQKHDKTQQLLKKTQIQTFGYYDNRQKIVAIKLRWTIWRTVKRQSDGQTPRFA